MQTVDANKENSITIKHSTYQQINEIFDTQRKQAYETVYHLSLYLKDEEKALTAFRKGLTVEHFNKPEFKNLTIEWVWKYLQIEDLPNII